MSTPEIVRWYCHTCGVTHEHTPQQRDDHRDEIMQDWSAQIAAKARP